MANVIKDISSELATVSTAEALEEIRIKYFGKKGIISLLAAEIKNKKVEEKAEYGQKVNEIKAEASKIFSECLEKIETSAMLSKMSRNKIDITQPTGADSFGTLHPLTQVVNKIVSLLTPLGFIVATGEEIVSDEYNFEKLNLDKNHPARDMQDTFYFNTDTLLRTHTSSVQIKIMESQKEFPIKIICPGKVYRRDDDDATHSHQFMQIEGLFIDKKVSMADLKATLSHLLKGIFGDKVETRFRPSYFPFTEPSVEVDISCFACKNAKKCVICKKTGWIEVLGAGMTHPQVLENSGIDSKKYQGFAFGLGVERIAMLKFGIKDIRDFYRNDLRFNKQFRKEF